MVIKIQELSEETLEKGIKLVESIFELGSTDLDHPKRFLPASLHPETKKSKRVYASTGCTELKYFVVIDNGKVVGITGYYTLKKDQKQADWLAWFAVDKKYRRKRLGTKLLNFIKNNAKERKKKFLRLYTDEKKDKVAQLFYEKVGLKSTKKEKSPYHKNTKITYREIKLN